MDCPTNFLSVFYDLPFVFPQNKEKYKKFKFKVESGLSYKWSLNGFSYVELKNFKTKNKLII